MNRTQAKQLTDDVREALEKVAADHGLTVKVGGGRYSDTTFAPRIEFQENGHADSEWRQWAELLGIRRNLGDTFEIMGVTYTITGIRPRAPKRPVTAARRDGKEFAFTVAAVNR